MAEMLYTKITKKERKVKGDDYDKERNAEQDYDGLR